MKDGMKVIYAWYIRMGFSSIKLNCSRSYEATMEGKCTDYTDASKFSRVE